MQQLSYMKLSGWRIRVKRVLLLCISCLCGLSLTGCLVGPNYHPQEANVPPAWTGATAPITATSAYANLIQWWTAFNDPNMTLLITRAMETNLDLKQAQSRIRQARAQRGIVASGLWPTADATGSYTRVRTPGIAAPATSSNLFRTGLDAAWELDVFGGTRRAVEAADAGIQFAVEDRRDVLVTLVSEVALNYLDLRGFQQEIIIARNNLTAQQHSAEVTRKRFHGGFVGALDVANADAQVATTASVIPTLEASTQQTIYSLSVLLGLEPTALLKELSPASAIPTTPPDVPMGIPSDLLRRRPDIRRAEAQIHAATANIGVATADLFPKFNLTGSLNFQNDQLHRLVNWNQRSWSVGPAIDWQIFTAGRVRSNIELQKALQQQSVLTYQQTVLTALQDVENALVAYAKEYERRKALVDSVAANRKAVDLSMQLYTQGLTDFLNVLNAQRSLLATEDALVQSTRNLSTDLVALYKALGGGWDSASPDVAKAE
jgi:multidrug efflux system outer membrane protein